MSLGELDRQEVRNPSVWPAQILATSAGMILLIVGPILYTIVVVALL